MNAVNTDLAQGLVAAVRELDEDPQLTAGVLTGAGRGFVRNGSQSISHRRSSSWVQRVSRKRCEEAAYRRS